MTSKKTTDTTPSEAKPRSPRKKATPKKSAAKPARKAAAKPRAGKKAAAAATPDAEAAPGKPAGVRRQPTHEEIAARAREIWREKGGTAFENWIEAERELDKD